MKKIGIISLLVLCLILSGCSHIEDTNGNDDFSLQTISIEDAKGSMNSTSVGSIETHVFNSDSIRIKKFSGISVLDNRVIRSYSKIKIVSSVTSGNFGIFILLKDKIYEIPINQEYYFDVSNYSGICVIKYAGESAEFKIEYEYIH